jgi:hypothetical protein
LVVTITLLVIISRSGKAIINREAAFALLLFIQHNSMFPAYHGFKYSCWLEGILPDVSYLRGAPHCERGAFCPYWGRQLGTTPNDKKGKEMLRQRKKA